ncbi:hypothetical protein B0J17DRAFT_312381 [Rhizoctonia solani]|nr:hypothetical protein B0J17DRAFT_312381 [Rhizoctonia solani]
MLQSCNVSTDDSTRILNKAKQPPVTPPQTPRRPSHLHHAPSLSLEFGGEPELLTPETTGKYIPYSTPLRPVTHQVLITPPQSRGRSFTGIFVSQPEPVSPSKRVVAEREPSSCFSLNTLPRQCNSSTLEGARCKRNEDLKNRPSNEPKDQAFGSKISGNQCSSDTLKGASRVHYSLRAPIVQPPAASLQTNDCPSDRTSIVQTKGRPQCITIIKSQNQQCSRPAQEGREDCFQHPCASVAKQVSESKPSPDACHTKTKKGRWCRNHATYPSSVDGKRHCAIHLKVIGSIGHRQPWTTTPEPAALKEPTYQRSGKLLSDAEICKWIPHYLSSSARSKLQKLMQRGPNEYDEEGYIYAIRVRGRYARNHYHVKVGRTINLNRRLKAWSECGFVDLLGWWPGNILDKGRERRDPGPMGGNHRLLERLIQTELADLACYSWHLTPDFFDEPQGSHKCRYKQSRPPNNYQRPPCGACGKIHVEVFTLERAPNGELTGHEWGRIIEPIIKKWGRFVTEYYD